MKDTPIARPSGRDMGCLLWGQHLIDILPHFLQWRVQYHVILDCIITSLDCNSISIWCHRWWSCDQLRMQPPRRNPSRAVWWLHCSKNSAPPHRNCRLHGSLFRWETDGTVINPLHAALFCGNMNICKFVCFLSFLYPETSKTFDVHCRIKH